MRHGQLIVLPANSASPQAVLLEGKEGESAKDHDTPAEGLSLCTSPRHDYVPSWLSLSREAAGKGLTIVIRPAEDCSCLSEGPNCARSRAWIGGSMTDQVTTEDPG